MLESANDTQVLRGIDDLLAFFHGSEKPVSEFRIGAEAEKFGVDADNGAPLDYAGARGVTRIFSALEVYGWQPERETADGPVIAMRRGQASITLEPGAQLELSGAALPDLHGVRKELDQHLEELEPVSRAMNLCWLGVGFHPLARQADLPWVPKQRYVVMREYLPKRGPAAHDMMRRTATVQANFDFSDEADAMRKLCVTLKLSPLINALTANSPFAEGRLAGVKSRRGQVWLHMDPDRSGLIPSVLAAKAPTYRDYAEWALDAGMFLFKRQGKVVTNTGQSFRDFWQNGYQGERATLGDWKLHLNTLFPEVRLKNTLEVRACDCLPKLLGCAVPALFTGILYDETALEQAEVLARSLDYATLEAARPDLVTRGLESSVAGRSMRELAERILEISNAGLGRRARLDSGGKDERVHLAPLIELVQHGKTPADQLLEGLDTKTLPHARELIRRTRM